MYFLYCLPYYSSNGKLKSHYVTIMVSCIMSPSWCHAIVLKWYDFIYLILVQKFNFKLQQYLSSSNFRQSLNFAHFIFAHLSFAHPHFAQIKLKKLQKNLFLGHFEPSFAQNGPEFFLRKIGLCYSLS